jgi:hypothetical protein
MCEIHSKNLVAILRIQFFSLKPKIISHNQLTFVDLITCNFTLRHTWHLMLYVGMLTYQTQDTTNLHFLQRR